MIPKDLETAPVTPDFATIAKESYSLIEEARAQRRREAELRVERRFARANTSIGLMSQHDRDRAIDLEANYDRTCRLVVRADGSVTIGQVRLMQNVSKVIASAGLEAADPSGLAAELFHSYEHAQHLLHAPKTLAHQQREMRLNRNASLTPELT